MFKQSSLVGLISLACVGFAMGGCGSGSKSSSTASTTTKHASPITVTKRAPAALPHATEPLSSFEKRLTVAVREAAAGKCGPVAAFGKSSGLILPCKGPGAKGLANFKVTGSATYGTGAVVEFTDADVASQRAVRAFKGIPPAGTGNTGVYALALSASGKYVYAPAGAPPVLTGPYIGTKATGWTGADAAAIRFLDAVRGDNCDVWFKNTLTPRGMPQEQACRLGLDKAYVPLRQALSSGHPVKLARLGGNAIFYYYWLQIGNQGGTVAMARDLPPSPPFLALGATPAPKQ